MKKNILTRAGSLALVGALALAGCSGETKTETVQVQGPRVTVSGDFVVVAGATIQLAAATAGGTDASYAWQSSNTAAATVSSTGLVTGVAAGNAVITATGATSQAAGTYNVVVVAAAPDLAAFSLAWTESGHARVTDEAFRHWDADGEIETGCARCHSATGFADYLGDDGSAVGVVDVPQPISGAGVNCAACHNPSATALTSVTFPSAATLDDLGAEARCMACHQGVESTVSVDAAILAAAAVDDDTVAAGLGFKNVHYFAAGATQAAGIAKGGYQYAGKVYDWKFGHVGGLSTCIDCHDPHSLELDLARCGSCHTGVTDLASLKSVRWMSSTVDYDGDGDVTEGIALEIDGLRTALYAAIQGYAADAGAPICYSAAAYPYFFNDTSANGTCEAGEATFPNRYLSWTNRLLRAAYNYQFSLKDPGNFAHNAKYVIQLAYDALQDLGADVTALARDDHGHFFGASEAFRHWDGDGAVSAACTKCHAGSAGFRRFVAGQPLVALPPQGDTDCATCHTAFPPTSVDPKLVSVTQVVFPGGTTVAADAADGADKLVAKSFICMTCHSGRESKATVDTNLASANVATDDTVSTSISFKNVHYAAAGATLLGSEAKVGYEYAGKAYVGRETHFMRGIDCSDCHDVKGHTFAPQVTTCDNCHTGIVTLHDIRESAFDYDGDGDTAEPLADELDALAAKALDALKAYAVDTTGDALCYDELRHPYFYVDSNADGDCAGETTKFTKFTPRLSRGAFNYQFAHKEHGAWAHNMTYASQLLFDTIEDLGGDTTGLARATAP